MITDWKEYWEREIRFYKKDLESVLNVDGKTIITFKSGRKITYPIRLEP